MTSMHMIAVGGMKGGAGRTTTCAMLADAWSRGGKSVVLVDLDSATGTLSQWLQGWPRGRLVPASEELRLLERDWVRDPLGHAKASRWLQGRISGPEDLALLDLPTAAGTSVVAALGLAQAVLVPIPLGSPAAVGTVPATERLLAEVDAALGGERQVMFLPVMLDRRGSLCEEILAGLRKALGARMLRAEIPIATEMARAVGLGTFPGATSPVSLAYGAAAREIWRRLQ
jgi:cellulose biosynthesis protein BcsQ